MNTTCTARDEDFRDRSRWLVVVGMIEILIGCFSGLLGLLLSLFSPFFRQNPATESLVSGKMLVATVLMLAALALLFVWLGIGTVRARRWALDMMLVTAWLWLIVGALALILVFLVLPRVLSEMAGPGQGPLGAAEIAVAMVIFAAVLGFPYVILPGFFVLFYSGKNVRRTFETRDPTVRWTGKCPLPVLTASQFLAGSAITPIVMLAYTDTVPVFGAVLAGFPARLILILTALLYGYLTWAIYKLKAHAWWISLLFTILSLAWFLGSYTNSVVAELSAKEDFSLRLGDQIISMDLLGGKVIPVLVGILGAAWVVFLILIKKYFRTTPQR